MNLTDLLSISFELALNVLPRMGILRCFVLPTVTYSAQIDESLLLICFDSHYIVQYMRWNGIEWTAIDLRSKLLRYADNNIYRPSWRRCVTYLFSISLGYSVYALNLLLTTASDSRSKMLCYADFNIHRSSRRKCVIYPFWFSLYYWVYELNLLCQYC